MTQSAPATNAHVVLGHDDGVTRVDQAVQLSVEQIDVGGMQSGGGLVEDVEGVPAPGPLQLGRQLDALGLAAGELGRGLPEPQVAQPDLLQRRQAAGGGRDVGEGTRRLVDGHREHVGDGAVAVADLEGVVVVAGTVARRAGAVGAGQEQQLDGDEALALAGRAATVGDVEGEPARRPAAPLGAPGSRRRRLRTASNSPV